MTLLDHESDRSAVTARTVRALQPLVRAEARAEAPAAGLDPADLEQTVWLRLLERPTGAVPPGDPARWVRDTVRAEARGRRTVRRERPYAGTEPAAPLVTGPERAALGAAEGRARAAMARLPGRCARLLEAMLSPADPTYREIAGELGISQGSLGPIRSRCLGCLRRMLAAEVAVPELRGRRAIGNRVDR
ncbi:sigma-70 family RNA polymerase sigma factor [Streptomyces sp. S6]|nr:sigma-70 family RNA polymerase sigma factor [Streptomyces sp. S6]